MIFLLLPLFCLQDPEELAEWVDQLGADYQEERQEAYQNLKESGKPAEAHLIRGVRHEDYRVRGSCITLLTVIKSQGALDPISAVFRNPTEDRDVKKKAFSYLTGMGKAAEDILIETLDRSELDFRLGALQALRKMKSTKCAEKVAELYDREEVKKVKSAAFECLKNLGKSAQPHLLKLLGSEDAVVREGALTGLGNINQESKDPEVIERIGGMFQNEVDRTVLVAAFRFLKGCGKDALPHFVAGLGSLHLEVQEKSLEGLVGLKAEEGLEGAAVLFLSTTSDTIRLRAKEYMQILGTLSESHFIKALEHPKPKVKLLAVDALGNLRSEKPRALISKMFREEKDPKVHRAAFRYLVRLEEKAEEDLLFAVKDSDKEIRLEAIRTVGKIRSEKAIPYLVSHLGTLDQAVEDASIDALVRIGPRAVAAVQKEVREGRVDERSAQRVLSLFHQEQVEAVLLELVSEDAGFGYFKGMFSGLEKIGRENTVPVLLRIAEDSSYQSRILEVKGTRGQFNRALRELCILAVGDLGDESVVPRLKKILKATSSFGLDDEYGHLIVALYKLGDPAPFKTFVARLQKEALEALSGDMKEDGYEKLFSIGLVQNRVGLRDAAEKTYRELVERINREGGGGLSDVYPDTLYNLACLRALRGEKKGAITMLRKAVVAGFRDRDWILKDNDLASLRQEDSFQALLAEKALFKQE